jgi:redox-sensing transcriptional repressor
VAVVGAGRIGVALLGYEDFRRQGFWIEEAFDADPLKVGQERHGLVIRPDEEMEVVLSSGEIDIVIVAVPSEVAQSVVDRVVAAGVRGILNFAPTKLNVPSGVALKNVNMAMELEALSYALANSEKRPRKAAAARGVNAAG